MLKEVSIEFIGAMIPVILVVSMYLVTRISIYVVTNRKTSSKA